jgi:hypothetical protein
MVFISRFLKKIHNAQYNTGEIFLQKDVGEDGVNIIAMADCEFYTNKKGALTGTPGIVSSTKNLAIAALGWEKHTFVAFEKDGQEYYVVLQKYNSESEIDEDFLNCDSTSIESGFRSKRGTSILSAKCVKVTMANDGVTFIFTPTEGNGLLATNQLKITPSINPDNEKSEDNCSQCISYLRSLIVAEKKVL